MPALVSRYSALATHPPPPDISTVHAPTPDVKRALAISFGHAHSVDMTKKKQPPTPIYVRPTDTLREQLDARAKQERRTVKAVVEAALWAYLKTDVGEVAS